MTYTEKFVAKTSDRRLHDWQQRYRTQLRSITTEAQAAEAIRADHHAVCADWSAHLAEQRAEDAES